MKNLVSIYIPTKNRSSLLKRAVESVLAQTVRDIELIIVSDGSEDDTCDYVRSIVSDIPIHLIHNDISVGACAARNQALEKSSGKFVTGLDDDDYFMPHRIESFLGTWARFEKDGRNFSCLFDTSVVNDGEKIHTPFRDASASPADILSKNKIGNQVFTTRARMFEAGLYDPLMPAWQDWELWARLLQKFGEAININACSYFTDISHEFERISAKSPDKIKRAAALFYAKHCSRRNLPGLLLALAAYPQITFTLNDIFHILLSAEPRLALRKLYRGQFIRSSASSVLS